jgi:hypothetical protein
VDVQLFVTHFVASSSLKKFLLFPDIIDELVKSGKEIEAVYFASEAGLTERFSPVSLIKLYLKNSKKNASTILKNGNNSMAAIVCVTSTFMFPNNFCLIIRVYLLFA